MPDITSNKSISISSLLGDISLYKYNPSAIQHAMLDYLADITSGDVDIINPTNPFVFLLEASAVNTAAAMFECHSALRNQYAALAQNEDELYRHMSDMDYSNRFATPSSAKFTFMIQVNDLLNKMLRDVDENCMKVTIPRNTEFRIEGLTFTMQYPIDIRQYDNGVVQVSYDATTVTPLQELSTNVIDYYVKQSADGINWLVFSIDVSQIVITSTHYVVQASSAFSQDIQFDDQYYFCRVYYKTTLSNNKWVEMKTTHTDQVYDIYKPTAVLKVTDNMLNVFIPQVYVNNQLIDGNIRIDIYATRGTLAVDMSNYNLRSFETRLTAVDEENDIHDFTNAMSNVVYMAYSDDIVNGGSDKLDFYTLRDQVINNAVGIRNLPITNLQLTAMAKTTGFDIVTDVDVITNRIFVATKQLPAPTNGRLVTAASLTIETLVDSLEGLKLASGVIDNYNRLTLRSNTVFLYDNGNIRICTAAELAELSALMPATLADTVSNSSYLYTPFYYVLDNTTNEFDMRAYHLDNPTVLNLNFVAQNQSVQLPVNTGSYFIEKTSDGYNLYLTTKSGNFYKELDDVYVQAQLAFIPAGESVFAYLNGELIQKNDQNERVYRFKIETNHDISSTDLLSITNFSMFTNEQIITPINLETVFSIFYTTTSVPVDFQPSDIDQKLGKFILPKDVVGVTHEYLKISLGSPLKNLWSRVRSVVSGLTYEHYTEDVYQQYDEDVYDTDPVTGTIFTVNSDNTVTYLKRNSKGDIVKDNNGNNVILHHKGDVINDADGNPVVTADKYIDRHCDLLLIDGCYYFGSDKSHISYRSDIANTVAKWVTDDLGAIEGRLLEKTEIYYYPKRSIGLISVQLGDNKGIMMQSRQSFSVELYVADSVYKDNAYRDKLIADTVSTINDIVQKTEVNISDMIAALKTVYGQGVKSVRVAGLGGSDNYESVTISKGNENLCLKKKLIAQEDGTLIVVEDVTISFINSDNH